MKIAIVTYSGGQNCGAQLQAYALTRFLNKTHDCKLVNFHFDKRAFKPRKNVGDIIWSVLTISSSTRRIRNYINFRNKYLPLTELCEDEESLIKLNSEFDIFITGSDQVWNCNGRVNPNFFLRFVSPDKIKASYAPSFGSDSIPTQCDSIVAEYIKKFDYVSVRENSGANIIRNLTGIEAIQVCDPVFLLSVADWKQTMAEPLEAGKYAFVYSTQLNRELTESVQRFYAKTRIKIVSTNYIPGCNCRVRKDIGPREFLRMIFDAEYVISTSFHATAFSIIFHKNFSVIPHSQTGARVNDLLEELELDTRVYREDAFNDFGVIDNWNDVETKISKKAAISVDYLNTVCRGEKTKE